MLLCCLFFFFKQKTAYEMRISDWSSDVCSSDLGDRRHPLSAGNLEREAAPEAARRVEARHAHRQPRLHHGRMETGASAGGGWTHDLFLARACPQMKAWKQLNWAIVVILVGCTPSGRDDTSAVGPDGKPLRAPAGRYEPTHG